MKDRYRLEELLGRGGMASVWLASDEVLERPVAVKVLSDTIASDPEFLARFRREARVAAGLSHPNLIGIYDYADGAERPYLVMEYVPGENLAERMPRAPGIDCERLARELLGALAHIHAAGIVHRDVKPQNVLIAPDGSAKLIDFGIALTEDATSLTQTGHLLGTARYLAPEAMSGRPATERSDLYSCGIVLRDCVGEGHPGRLRALVERLSSVDPGGRPASAKEAIAQIKHRTPVPDQPTQRLKPAPPRPRSEPRVPRTLPEPHSRHSALGKAAAVVAALAALAVAFLLVIDGSQNPGSGKQDASVAANGREATEAPGRSETEASTTAPAPSGDDPALAGALNEEGFEMIQAGSYEEAVPVLEEAIRAFPAGTEDLNYAYALFNLGNALRLSGRPEEAIPVLERRLEIPNQTGAVRSELTAARREANP
ncbi:MAG TPA: serine/threonine-protein kinase [Solirubrobacterales bacterium]|nr:serine/threonine-protein kinase [Solirubrobacterales bacterium]